jgi:fumarate hydratase class I
MRKLQYPFRESDVRSLRAGETVSLSGRVFTGRDRLHRYLFNNGACPVDLRDGAMYHCGPVTLQKDGRWVVCAAGPTTSIREEPYMPRIIEKYGMRVILGKGGMGDATVAACRKFGCVYLQTVGGAAALLAQKITAVPEVHFLREFGQAEALWVMDVQDLQAVVTIDSRGRSLHRRIRSSSTRAMRTLLAAG